MAPPFAGSTPQNITRPSPIFHCMIANTFIKRPVTAMVISIVLVIAGAICILTLPIDQYPDITPPVVQVNGQFTWRGRADGRANRCHPNRAAGERKPGDGIYAEQQH